MAQYVGLASRPRRALPRDRKGAHLRVRSRLSVFLVSLLFRVRDEQTSDVHRTPAPSPPAQHCLEDPFWRPGQCVVGAKVAKQDRESIFWISIALRLDWKLGLRTGCMCALQIRTVIINISSQCSPSLWSNESQSITAFTITMRGRPNSGAQEIEPGIGALSG